MRHDAKTRVVELFKFGDLITPTATELKMHPSYFEPVAPTKEGQDEHIDPPVAPAKGSTAKAKP